MHVLITGGTGFIGHALCERLLADGHSVTVKTRDKDRSFGLLPHAVNLVQHYQEIRRASPPELVINLAGENLAAARWSAARKQALFDSRVVTTRELVEYLGSLKQRPAALLTASAIGWYGARGDESLTETAASGTGFAAELCRGWEAQAQQAEQLGIRVCRLRIGLVLAPGGGALARMLPAFRAGLGGRLGSGRQWMSWIHRDDLVSLLLWLATRNDSGAFNATAPKPVTNAEFTRALGAALGRPAILAVPAPVLRLALGELAELLLTGQKVLPARALLGGFRFAYTRIEEALTSALPA